jgi:rubredoxin
MRTTRAGGAHRCPACRSRHIAAIVRGYPTRETMTAAQADDGEIVLGGCLVADGDADFHCNSCGHEWALARGPAAQSAEEATAFEEVVSRLPWRRCRPEYAAQVGDHEYVVRNKTCDEAAFAVLTTAIWSYGRRERYVVTGSTFTYFVHDAYRYWTAPGWTVINRAVEADLIGKYEPAIDEPTHS